MKAKFQGFIFGEILAMNSPLSLSESGVDDTIESVTVVGIYVDDEMDDWGSDFDLAVESPSLVKQLSSDSSTSLRSAFSDTHEPSPAIHATVVPALTPVLAGADSGGGGVPRKLPHGDGAAVDDVKTEEEDDWGSDFDEMGTFVGKCWLFHRASFRWHQIYTSSTLKCCAALPQRVTSNLLRPLNYCVR